MITRADLVERVREWGLAEQVVEKDYVLGWVLWGIGTDSVLGQQWVFKGGTCLKKCYIETYRFSEDLDFTVLPGGVMAPDDVMPYLERVLARVGEESGIDFTMQPPRLRLRPSGKASEGRVYYRGPRQTPQAASVKLDLSADEQVVRPPVLRPVAHPYPDPLPHPGTVRCYSFEELFAEKLRAMGQRGRPRDLYDIVNLFRRSDLRLHAELVRDVLVEKCRIKSVDVPTFASVAAAPHRAELESEWANMLGHQLPALPPLKQFLDELPDLFAWLHGEAEYPALAAIAGEAGEDLAWTPPPTAATWRQGVPLEPVRFAATNRLCVALTYNGTVRLIEPYSLRRTNDGYLVFHALRVDNRQHRSYRVDRIQRVEVTTRPFRPVYAVEFSSSGPMAAPPVRRSSGYAAPRPSSRSRQYHGPVYVVQCPNCQKQFRRQTRDLALRPHKAPQGYNCSGRRGYLVRTDYR
ncbi:MAG: nucleotidyl transferase AbiEii/AbiGii toxin family protein [Actinobacteria bacterium]|nr:nucleotidyl transferase AbiEii/AbiGii toxin family protein [Actinomycetota bacterium]